MTIRFLLICEGSSDTALVSHIQALLIDCGASRPMDLHHIADAADKVRIWLQYNRGVNLLFIHRDADKMDPDTRYDEIREAVTAAGYDGRWVGVVPVRMMEAATR